MLLKRLKELKQVIGLKTKTVAKTEVGSVEEQPARDKLRQVLTVPKS